jgi:hypothetical protein
MKVRSALLGLVLFLWAAPAFSQGCAMCRSSAAATSKDGQRAISKGVLVLVLPPAGAGLSLRKEARFGELLSKHCPVGGSE